MPNILANLLHFWKRLSTNITTAIELFSHYATWAILNMIICSANLAKATQIMLQNKICFSLWWMASVRLSPAGMRYCDYLHLHILVYFWDKQSISDLHMSSSMKSSKNFNVAWKPYLSTYGQIFCGDFQRYPLQFNSKYFTHALRDM